MGRAQSIMLTGIELWAFFMGSSLYAAIENKKSVESSNLKVSSKLESTKSESEDELYWLCRNSLEVRTVRVEQKAEYCVAYYTKQGLDEEVLKAKKVKNCTPIVSKVKSNLEKGGWICKNISDSSITK